MKKCISNHIFLIISFIFGVSVYGADSTYPSESKKIKKQIANVALMNVENGEGFAANVPFESYRHKTMHLVDTKNLKIELGKSSVAMIKADNEFRLLRGSSYLETQRKRVVKTVYAQIEFQGRIMMSYDYKEQSSSVFVISGSAKIKNNFNQAKVFELFQNQGASLLHNKNKPLLLRGMTFAKVKGWLSAYGWEKERLKVLLDSVPEKEPIVTDIGIAQMEIEKKAERLKSYFSAVEEEVDAKHYERLYTGSALSGKHQTDLERDLLEETKSIQFITPEQAATIRLPEIHLGPSILRDKFAEENRKTKVTKKRRLKQGRKLASVTKRKRAKKIVGDPAIAHTLQRLNGLGTELKRSRTVQNSDLIYDDLMENF